MTTTLILISLVLLLLVRVPVAFSLAGLGLILLILKGFTLTMVPLSLFSFPGQLYPSGGTVVSSYVQRPVKR